MSLLEPLLELQAQDVAADAARQRSSELPERASLPRLAAELAGIQQRIDAARAELAERQADEERLGGEVSRVVRDIEAADVDHYSGKRKGRDAATAHDEAQQQRRDVQAELEEREMALLEEIETLTARIGELESLAASNRIETERITAMIGKVEDEVAAELARFAEARAGLAAGLPAAVLAAYDRVRAQPRKGGRGAARLADGCCDGCRIKLPKLEHSRMLAEAEDAVIQCPQCRRVLVR
jgi:hypothetical protein